MSRRPIFSTYTSGENRVTSTLLAVFEHVGLDLTERILAGASGEASLGLVAYLDQPSKGGSGVPDGEIRSRFRYLVETKTQIGQFNTDSQLDQLRRHLGRLDGSYGDERLFVLTPDADMPAQLENLDDERIIWIGFKAVAEAIEGIVTDEDEPASESQRFLLRQLVELFNQEGLIDTADTLVVAARAAYPKYLETGVYVCQPRRSFRDVPYVAFYTEKAIQREVARRLDYVTEVLFSEPSAAIWESDGTIEHGGRVAEAIRHHLARGLATEGDLRGVMVLSLADDPATTVLAAPVRHQAPGAWTQGQRYARLDLLRDATSTADLEAQ